MGRWVGWSATFFFRGRELQRFAKVLSKAEEGEFFFVECKWGKLVCTILRLDVLGQETCRKVDGKRKILIMRMKLELKQRYQSLLIL